jgi:hypothetical protein
MIDFDEFSSEVFQTLRAYGRDMVLYDDHGNRVYEPYQARRIYMTGDNILVSIYEDGDNSAMRLFLSPSMNLSQVQGFIDTLRVMASKANLLFHVRKFDKEIKPQDFASVAAVTEQEINTMNLLEGMYGTSKSSYLKLENARMIVRHSERVKENMIGARGRSIQQIFVEDARGQRFLFPFNMLTGARAMTQHVNQGGTFADNVGQQIIRMAGNFSNLAHATSALAAKQEATTLRSNILGEMKSIKLAFNRLYETRSYVRESARILETSTLMEDGDMLAERFAALRSLLGESVSDEVIMTVARLVALPESEEAPVEEDGITLEASPESLEDAPSDAVLSDDTHVSATKEDELVAPENNIIKQFEAWLAEFDPEVVTVAAAAEEPETVTADPVEVAVSEEPEVLDEYRVKAQDVVPAATVHDVKSEIQAVKTRLLAVGPFDPEYSTLRTKLVQLEKDLSKISPYGKAATTESEEVDGTSEENADSDEAQFDAEMDRLATLSGMVK